VSLNNIRPQIVFSCVVFLLCCGILPAGAEAGGPSVAAAGSGQVMVVTIGKSTVGKIPSHSIKKITVRPGLMTPYRKGGLSTGTLQMSIVDAQGRMLYSTDFSFPTHMTVPPLPPGTVDDGMPAVIYLEEPEVVLVVPYFPDADSINIYRAGELVPLASKSLSNAGIKNGLRNERSVVISPAPADAGNFNILVTASGYTSSNMTNFQGRATVIKDAILAADPFSRYASKVHVNIFSNTADLGCYTGCDNIDRLMCCDSAKVISAAAGSGYSYDEIIVVHNTATYAGGGYRAGLDYKSNSYSSYCMVYDGPYSSNMALHEFGHSFGDLCDEYTYTSEGYSYSDCVNCRATCADWQTYTTACILGCDAKPTTYYRPDNSVMLSLDYANYNEASIKATYSPDGLEERLQFFTGETIAHSLTAPSNTNVNRGGTFGPITSSITNNYSSSYSLYLYASVYTPKGSWVDTVYVPMTLAAGQTVSKNDITRWIPPLADTGVYYFCEYLYDTSWNALGYKCINFTVY
jgi:hypothetical protein